MVPCRERGEKKVHQLYPLCLRVQWIKAKYWEIICSSKKNISKRSWDIWIVTTTTSLFCVSQRSDALSLLSKVEFFLAKNPIFQGAKLVLWQLLWIFLGKGGGLALRKTYWVKEKAVCVEKLLETKTFYSTVMIHHDQKSQFLQKSSFFANILTLKKLSFVSPPLLLMNYFLFFCRLNALAFLDEFELIYLLRTCFHPWFLPRF